MDKQYKFDSERLLYRGVEKRDASILVNWRSDSEIIRYFVDATPISMNEHLRWFEKYQLDETRYDFMIIHKEEQKEIGFVGVNHIDGQHCFINYTIADRDCRRHGYAVEAVMALCNCFHKEGLHCFLSKVHKDNISSRKVMERLQFIEKSVEGDFITFEYFMPD